jgi:TolB-like protein
MAMAQSLLFGLALSTLSPVATAAPTAKPAAPAAPVLAVADFGGSDKEVGRFIAESLLTGLGQSSKLRLLEGAEVRGAMGALKLPSGEQLDPHQVRLLGQRLGASRLLIGSYLVQDDQIIINARVLDMQSGRPATGGAGSVSGSRQELLGLTQRLASRIHQSLTGKDLPLEAAPAPASTTSAAAAAKTDADVYTGLVLDARDLPLQRAMGPRILDQDGQVLYPDPKNVPDTGYLEDKGMAAYIQEGQDALRSGSRPLVVHAIQVAGPAREDLVVDNETAEQIRQANQRDGFLVRWAVSILIGAR